MAKMEKEREIVEKLHNSLYKTEDLQREPQ